MEFQIPALDFLEAGLGGLLKRLANFLKAGTRRTKDAPKNVFTRKRVELPNAVLHHGWLLVAPGGAGWSRSRCVHRCPFHMNDR